jgi:hypothetical protein
MMCVCGHNEGYHGQKFVITSRLPKTVYKGCKFAVCDCEQFVEAQEKVRDTMPADKKFVEWQIKTLQRMIHELRERHGLSE